MRVQPPKEYWVNLGNLTHLLSGFGLGYRVGRNGELQSCKKKVGLGRGKGSGCAVILTETWKPIAVSKSKWGYHSAQLALANRKRTFRIHHLVLFAFVGPRPKGMQGLHKNDDHDDNSVTNLYWGTFEQNMKDAVRNGARAYGVNHSQAALTESQVFEIVDLLKSGLSEQKIASRFGVTRGAVQGIKRGRTWKRLLGTNFGGETY